MDVSQNPEWVGAAVYQVVLIHTTGSRFTGASVACLVIGAMGCFIFGLYLRRWLRERKAIAASPVRDIRV